MITKNITVSLPLRFLLPAVMTFLWLFPFTVHAEKLRVRSMTITTDPMIAPMQRLDLNGQVCGLVKVIVPGPEFVFEGNLVGESEFKTSEYWCYLTPGTKMLKIKHPGLEPLMVDFQEFLPNGIESRRIYELVVEIPSISQTSGHPLELEISWDHTGTPNSKFLYPVDSDYWRVGDTKPGKLTVCLNDEPIDHSRIIGNVNVGDVLTVTTANPSYEPLRVIITEENLEQQKLKVTLQKKRTSIQGKVIDSYTGLPVENVKIGLYRKNPHSRYSANIWSDKFDPLVTFVTNTSGLFGFNNCIADYYYNLNISHPLPSGYRNIVDFWAGWDVVPDEKLNKANESTIIRSDSIVLSMAPTKFAGTVFDGKTPIPNVSLKYEGLYDNETITDSAGNFKILGIKNKDITISADGYKTLVLDIHDCLSRGISNLNIKLKKGNSSEIEYVYVDYYSGKIKKDRKRN